MVDGSEIDEVYENYLCWSLKMIMLCASYPEIINRSEYIRKRIEVKSNSVNGKCDLANFRDYNRYDYRFDLSTINNAPYGMRNATVYIVEIESDENVWSMHL